MSVILERLNQYRSQQAETERTREETRTMRAKRIAESANTILAQLLPDVWVEWVKHLVEGETKVDVDFLTLRCKVDLPDLGVWGIELQLNRRTLIFISTQNDIGGTSINYIGSSGLSDLVLGDTDEVKVVATLATDDGSLLDTTIFLKWLDSAEKHHAQKLAAAHARKQEGALQTLKARANSLMNYNQGFTEAQAEDAAREIDAILDTYPALLAEYGSPGSSYLELWRELRKAHQAGEAARKEREEAWRATYTAFAQQCKDIEAANLAKLEPLLEEWRAAQFVYELTYGTIGQDFEDGSVVADTRTVYVTTCEPDADGWWNLIEGRRAKFVHVASITEHIVTPGEGVTRYLWPELVLDAYAYNAIHLPLPLGMTQAEAKAAVEALGLTQMPFYPSVPTGIYSHTAAQITQEVHVALKYVAPRRHPAVDDPFSDA